ncbi:MAG TPA: sulfotransferase [Caulobacteraceae bacterium]|nr:sulfotransferase [Caulobacteraceae bacterium]
MPLEVPNAYLSLAPVIITAPTPRCGTTLAQRLLSTADNAFIYGEEVGHHIRTLTNFMVGLIAQFERDGAANDADFERALAGALTDWRPGLMPPTRVIQGAWVHTYYQIPMALADFGASIGRPVWGFKGPDYARDQIRAFLMLMPRARVIYIVRRLEDALASAKARRFVKDDAEVATFCATWAKNLGDMLALNDNRILLVRYEEFVAAREAHIQALQAFTGAIGLKASAFDTKVNTFAGAETDGFSPTQYISPADLTERDLRAVDQAAGPLLATFYAAGT